VYYALTIEIHQYQTAITGICIDPACPASRNKKAAQCAAFLMNSWWEVQVSNLRPLQCECSALPLS
jgi:hypothetical protein